jgi:hypothetical protein
MPDNIALLRDTRCNNPKLLERWHIFDTGLSSEGPPHLP